ncbi:MAG: CDP-glucose 4,6-dehydratase [Tardiphaga sp.]|nr:CDP-glucose 4,6-dehydratase [Tardiphaga sp.]
MIDPGFWRQRRVFLTGHTGFKGAWMALLLRSFGAEVYGYSLEPDSEHGLFNAAGVKNDVHHRIGDIRDLADMRAALAEARPSVVIHMAAQALVRLSYDEPVETYATNVMGTVNLLEAARSVEGIEAILVVTSDKCYENTETLRGYVETEAMGGYDPYSSSKGCAEIVTAAYQRSFFQSEKSALVATARAGNVIGGGDWSKDRLVPDIMRSFMAAAVVQIRNPNAIRPWQHVMDPVIGYLTLVQRLVQGGKKFAEGWNFGPHEDSEVPVSVLVKTLATHWGADARWAIDKGEHPHEAGYLKLDCTKARTRLDWHPVIEFDRGLKLSSEWYRAFHGGADMRAVTLQQINEIVAPLTGNRRAS